ncbi:alpha/beta hydrolase family protein [Streptomyces hainanensis]|uniref:Alpha/beta hydrolase n=1 Tax=Streptomyces hainanensis TaxID=402648 RepID=A0A4R4TU09_9ACTN|nr:alpha/beta hydrolase [Streptomyces hainanensis]TDC79032.1 alpha/beta hydrolase [Streptomyces hainanensis]
MKFVISRGAATVAAGLALALAVPLASTAAAAGAAAPAPASGPPTDQASVDLRLPEPTGPSAVGRDTLHLVDTARADPWVPAAGARELLVSMFYPARAGTGRPAPYLAAEEARLLLESQRLEGVVTAEEVAATRITSRVGARPAAGRHPLVVLSPGFSLPRTTLTLLAEELASRGYVVAAVDHAYESVGTLFPGGRMLTCVACEAADDLAAVAEGRAADLSFVLDRLTGPRPAWRHAGLIDTTRIGMAGHSIGGNATAVTMAGDSRVRAGANLDGTFFAPVPAEGLGGRPFLMLGTESLHRPGGGDESWDQGWARLDGWRRWLTVTGSGHFTFIDLPVLGGQLGLTDPEAPLSGERSGEITRGYLAAFFDAHLRGQPQPLLDGPTAANPEVVFQGG